MITREDSVLVQLIRLVERLPSPPPPSARRPRGRPIFYPEKLFLKALVIMILRRLHRVGELLAVLDEPTPEMKIVRELLREEGRFPTRRTFQRRLKTLPERLPEQIGCLGRHLVEVLKPANTADNQIAPALIEQLPDEARFVLGDIHYNAPNLREACLHHSSDEERFLVTTKRGTYPHTDDGVEVSRIFHKLRSMANENFRAAHLVPLRPEAERAPAGLRPRPRQPTGMARTHRGGTRLQHLPLLQCRASHHDGG